MLSVNDGPELEEELKVERAREGLREDVRSISEGSGLQRGTNNQVAFEWRSETGVSYKWIFFAITYLVVALSAIME